jgi:hypothetical protein
MVFSYAKIKIQWRKGLAVLTQSSDGFVRKGQSVIRKGQAALYAKLRRNFTIKLCRFTQRSGCFVNKKGRLILRQGQVSLYAKVRQLCMQRSGYFYAKVRQLCMQRSGRFLRKGQKTFYPKVRCFLFNGKAVICARVMRFFHANIRLFFKQESSSVLRKGHAVFSCEDQAVFYSVLRRFIFYIYLFKKFGLIASFFRDLKEQNSFL